MFRHICENRKLACYSTALLVEINSHLWAQNMDPHEFEGIFEAQNVALVSGLQLG